MTQIKLFTLVCGVGGLRWDPIEGWDGMGVWGRPPEWCGSIPIAASFSPPRGPLVLPQPPAPQPGVLKAAICGVGPESGPKNGIRAPRCTSAVGLMGSSRQIGAKAAKGVLGGLGVRRGGGNPISTLLWVGGRAGRAAIGVWGHVGFGH